MYRRRLYAHRGANEDSPENTIEAFRQALDQGANAIELDIHMTRDQVFVVCHDADGRRTAGIAERVSSLDYKDVQRWRVGGDSRVPTLEEVLDTFSGTPMSIDIKPQRPSVVRPLLEVLDRHHAEDFVTLASFHHHQLVRTRAFGWSGRTALSRLEIVALRFLPLSVSRIVIRGQAAQIPRRFARVRLDGDSLLERCRRLGIRADFWVVNDPTEARELVDRGATGIMTDRPAMIAPAIF